MLTLQDKRMFSALKKIKDQRMAEKNMLEEVLYHINA